MGQRLEAAVLPEHYSTYVFDLYGTLVDIRTDEKRDEVWEKLALFYGYYGARYEGAELKRRYDERCARSADMENGGLYAHEAYPELEIAEIFQALFEEKGVRAERELAVHAGQFFRVLTTDYVRVYPGTCQMLAHLKKLGKQLYLLSNAQRIFTAHEMRMLGIWEYFDDIFISSDYRTKKPDPRFFEILTREHAFPVEDALFVGNDSKTDIAGAKQAGMHTFYVRSNISPKGDFAEHADYLTDPFTKWQYK